MCAGTHENRSLCGISSQLRYYPQRKYLYPCPWWFGHAHPNIFPTFSFSKEAFLPIQRHFVSNENKLFDLLYENNSIRHTSVYMHVCVCVSSSMLLYLR